MSRMIRAEDGSKVRPGYYSQTAKPNRGNPKNWARAYNEANPVARAAEQAAKKKVRGRSLSQQSMKGGK